MVGAGSILKFPPPSNDVGRGMNVQWKGRTGMSDFVKEGDVVLGSSKLSPKL